MLEASLDERQAEAVAYAGATRLAIVGTPGSGKTAALVARAERLARETAACGAVVLTAPSDAGIERLRHRAATGVAYASLSDLAFHILRDVRDVDEIDDVRASRHFERAGAELFSLAWTEFDGELDPEITGLRAPERFSAAAFRLIRKLRASLISPSAFEALGMRGATAFYAHPPNLANADLIMNTKAQYRDSLRASPSELERQRRREVDLVKILARLYGSYVDTLVANGCLTPVDAVYEAVHLLRERPDLRAAARARYAAALVDDAQDLTLGGIALLEATFDADAGAVTLAGDETQATRGFATGAAGGDALKRSTRIVLEGRYRFGSAIESAARVMLDPLASARIRADAVTLYRADSERDEARFVTTEIEALLREGTPAGRIAVIMRGLEGAQTIAHALLARNVPADVAGAGSIYAFPAVLDALAALWSAVDPYRHDYLLRLLESPWMRLCDASVATLCAEAADAQPLLFELPDDPEEPGDRRWDRRRNLRLGRNVTRGDVDPDLPPEARERLARFREARDRWEAAARTHDLPDHARLVLEESVLATLAPGARGRFDAALVDRLLDEIEAFAARDPLAGLDDFLAFAESVAASEADLLAIAPRDPAAVRILDAEAAKGLEFDAVFVVDARAGAWPRYYVPDAFLFTPSLGMIPKENVGDALAARTAKFTYALFRAKFAEKFVAEERRALYCAATRARNRLYVSASGRVTKGVSAPEVLAELMAKTAEP